MYMMSHNQKQKTTLIKPNQIPTSLSESIQTQSGAKVTCNFGENN